MYLVIILLSRRENKNDTANYLGIESQQEEYQSLY